MATFAVDLVRTRRHDLFEFVHEINMKYCIVRLWLLAIQGSQRRPMPQCLQISATLSISAGSISIGSIGC
jgi:hypothetical protein